MTIQSGESLSLPPCGHCHRGRYVSTGDGLQCINCGHEPNLSRLGISKAAMDPLRLMLRVMAFEELVRSAIEENDEEGAMLGELLEQVTTLRDEFAGVKVSGRLRPVKCPRCGQQCRSAQGLISHRRACTGAQSA